MWVRGRELGGGQRLADPAETVVEDCARPLRNSYTYTLTSIDDVLHGALDQFGRLALASPPGGDPEGTIGRYLAPRRVGHRFELVDFGDRGGELTGKQVHVHV